MRRSNSSEKEPLSAYRSRPVWRWIAGMAGALAVVVIVLMVRRHQDGGSDAASTLDQTVSEPVANAPGKGAPRRETGKERRASQAEPSAEEVVAGKVVQFGRKRRDLVHAIAARSGKPVPPEVERFFDALESGRWEDMKAQWRELAVHSNQYEYSTNHWENLDPFWPAVVDAYGVAEQAHDWPAQKLLDYGNSILGALRPGMVYVGGTDNGRWIPELINETSDGDQHMILTQNALADGRYLDFVNTLYGEQMKSLTTEDSQRAFQDYIADAQKRLQHDQEFPNEPRQVRPGEDIHVTDGKVQVSGQPAVMAVNERLLTALMNKNPDLAFAVQESYPLQGTYADALPLGPLMELNARNEQDTFTPERATQALEYWRGAAQQVLSDFDATGSENALLSYAHDAVSAANLLAAHNFTSEAEETYRLATQLWPGSPETVNRLADLLSATGRNDEATQLLSDFSQKYPDEQKKLDRFRSGAKILWTAR